MRQNAIYLEYGKSYLTEEELAQLDQVLNPHGIKLFAGVGDFRPRAFLYDICIFMSEHLSAELVQQMLSSAAYDLVKVTLFQIIKTIRSKMRIMQGHRLRTPKPCVKLHLDENKVSIIIPAELENQQFERYLNASLAVIKHEQERAAMPQSHRTNYIVELDDETNEPKLMTDMQYAETRQYTD